MSDIPEVVELAAREAALADLKAELDRRAQDLADQELALRRAAVVAFCDGLAAEARIRPADVPALSEIVLRLEPSEPALCFAAPDTESPAPGATWLKTFLAGLPPLVELSEVATQARAMGAHAPVSFATPAGYTVDSANLAIHGKAMAWLETHPESSYQAAVVAVAGA